MEEPAHLLIPAVVLMVGLETLVVKVCEMHEFVRLGFIADMTFRKHYAIKGREILLRISARSTVVWTPNNCVTVLIRVSLINKRPSLTIELPPVIATLIIHIQPPSKQNF